MPPGNRTAYFSLVTVAQWLQYRISRFVMPNWYRGGTTPALPTHIGIADDDAMQLEQALGGGATRRLQGKVRAGGELLGAAGRGMGGRGT